MAANLLPPSLVTAKQLLIQPCLPTIPPLLSTPLASCNNICFAKSRRGGGISFSHPTINFVFVWFSRFKITHIFSSLLSSRLDSSRLGLACQIHLLLSNLSYQAAERNFRVHDCGGVCTKTAAAAAATAMAAAAPNMPTNYFTWRNSFPLLPPQLIRSDPNQSGRALITNFASLARFINVNIYHLVNDDNCYHDSSRQKPRNTNKKISSWCCNFARADSS